MKNIVVLASGSGTNLERILEAINNGEISNVKVSQVVADRYCYALQRAGNHKIKNLRLPRKNFCNFLDAELSDNVDLIVCAGFLSILTPEFCDKWKEKIINIHPSLLPKFGGKGMWGMNVHRAVIEAKEKESGVSVHFVTSGIDEGQVILQGKVNVSSDDTPESLAEKIHKVEYDIFPKAIAKVLNEK